jgi:putative ATPase
MSDLFDNESKGKDSLLRPPLAERMRPKDLDEFVGQDHLIGSGRLLRRAIEQDEVPSLILWGPPGTGKTTLAHVIAESTGARFVPFSAVIGGVKEIRLIVEQAKQHRKKGRRTILFVDEIHRFNKAQQDAFLPHVESGTITLIGATTENPSFEVIAPLLSRARVVVLKPLSVDEVETIVARAVADEENGLGSSHVQVEDDALSHVVLMADGDARVALNAIEAAAEVALSDENGTRRITVELVEEAFQRKALVYDKAGEEHYNLISALHKSLRSSDVNAALYYLARMMEGGEDRLYIARRLVRFAMEDVGLADPQALSVAVAAKDAYHFLGSPEGELALAQCVIYLGLSPKSNRADRALATAVADVRERPTLPVPLHIRNAPTRLMKDLGYGRGYSFDHDHEDSVSAQECLPDELKGRQYYIPGRLGFEKELAKRLEWFEKTKHKLQEASGKSRGTSDAPTNNDTTSSS